MKGIIFHYGLFKIVWDWFVLLLVLYTAVEVPFLVCFIHDSTGKAAYIDSATSYALFVIDLSVDSFFFCDIIVNFRTTYIGRKGALETKPKKIALRYLRTYFVVDLVAAIPWDLILSQNTSTRESTVSLSLLKTVRLLRLFQAARRLDQNYEKSVSLLFLMVFSFTLVAHWLACIWYSIGYSESGKFSGSWLTILATETGQPINETSLRSRYLTALYFTLTCITSVGFGNVSPNTDWEKLFTIVSMLIGGLLFAAVFGNVSAIIYGHYSGTFKFRERMQSVKHFLGYHKIKGPLARKVKDYSRHLWTQTKGISTAKVLKQFPESLQEEINCYLHFNVIKNCPLFEHADDSCLWSLASRMNQLHHLPNNTIVRQGAIVNSVFFINRGRLDVCRNGAIVGTIGEGDAFGNLSIGTDRRICKSAVTLRSITCVEIHILYLKDLNELLEIFPEFSKELLKKTKSVLKKTVLTSQILSSWDAIEVEECSKHNGLDALTMWISRQKSKRNCNVNKEMELKFKKSKKRKRVNETLVTLPLVVLSPVCTSNEDAQKFWRFANIIDRGKENDRGSSASSSTYYSSKDDEERLPHNINKCMSDGCLTNTNHIKKDYSHECDNETTWDENLQRYKKLETSVQNVTSKLKSLENKVDTILFYLENQAKTNDEKSE